MEESVKKSDSVPVIFLVWPRIYERKKSNFKHLSRAKLGRGKK